MKKTPVLPSRSALRPLGLDEVQITGGYWGRRQETNAEATIWHCLHWLEKLGWIDNFEKAGTGAEFERAGREFSDSEIYKLAEAMAWEIGRSGSPELEARFIRLTEQISAALESDGYLSTMFGHPGQRPRYTDLEWGHELYCYGHLLQAAVARLRTHGEDDFVRLARQVADHVCDTFGPGGIERICGHAEIEVGLAEFARATGEQRYLDQAKLFIDRHGKRTLGGDGLEYYQDDAHVHDAEVLRGHAVRALYLSSGALDVAADTGDKELLEAVRRQWDRTLARRTHITGGMGSRYQDEAYGDDFALSPDRAYAESCAGIGGVMTAWRLLLATGELSYGDIIERITWNVLAGAVAPDGKSFFYANPLQQRTFDEVPPSGKAVGHSGAGGHRAPWYDVSCCPTNLARTFASLAAYIATVDDGGLQLHQYMPADIATDLADGPVAVRVETDYPESGTITIRIDRNEAGPWTLSLRVPDWADGAQLTGPDGVRRTVAPGRAEITSDFAAGDTVTLELPVGPRWTRADPRIDSVRGCVAVEQGPLVLCAESVDQPGGADVVDLSVDPGKAPVVQDGTVTVSGHVHKHVDAWPYGSNPDPEEGREAAEVALIPFHLRATRGPATMRVWLPTA
ncbi:glycoside hydrolase family 127 protein [Glycomyces buryatensis]|uniref:Glycoside hydrolase family 127 protein n=1 Tax=Glycomyces buryatensis TaxID=2570927 RepID=A0A4S8PZ08_9ACTN|nr:beta-L-arabinofuranosidase domain-containing protein [Glycomyces buryatensis]THV36983.1 glycoside hydrolase family 127 protein [Glycomyces buryatensis]